ncbi:flavocytochrome c [Spirochaetia bacterium]|nr:flavocytochrome c [Spirochaetia bacterium]
MKKRTISFVGAVLVLFLVLGCGTSGKVAPMKAGVYTASFMGMNGPVEVEVTLTSSAISSIKILSTVDTPGVSTWALEQIPQRIIDSQSVAVDSITGVSLTSNAIKASVEDCLKQAGANIADYKKPPRAKKAADETLSADVVIVGGGGAGLSASVAAVNAGATVILIEKQGFLGGNSIVSGGIINAANPEMQDHAPAFSGNEKLVQDAIAETPVNAQHKQIIDTVKAQYEAFKKTDKTIFDSPEWHGLQTWKEGDKIGDLNVILTMTRNGLAAYQDYKKMGTEFRPLVIQGTGAMYQRTYQEELPNGTGFIKAFRDNLAGKKNFTQILDTAAKSLIVENGRVTGVNAVAKDGHKVTLKAAKGVILATGGFAGNVELRVKYAQGDKWPDLGPALQTTNMPGVTGDGIFIAEAAGVQLLNMDQIQILQVCDPINGTVGGNSYPNDVGGYILVNKEGKRFVNEGGRRDVISKAIINQTDGVAWLVQSAETITDPDKITTLDGRTITYMLKNKQHGWVVGSTLEDFAKVINAPAANLKQTIDSFNTHIDSQKPDEFDRTMFAYKYTKGPWYAFPVKPAAHHTMGGVRIDSDGHALKADGTWVNGLYCAGEITGVIHGGNRLGGNAILDFTVFGKIAGTNAAAGK